MTLIPEGKIDGRPFAIRRNEKAAVTTAFICLDCMQETKPDRKVFARHTCEAEEKKTSRKPSAVKSTPDKVNDEKS